MRGEPITAGFALDEGFRRFYARFTISKRPMGVFALLSVPWVTLKLAEPVLVAEDPLVSFWVILLIPAEIILLFELLASFCTWLGAVRLQRLWLHLLDGEWHGSNPILDVSVSDDNVDVSLVKYGPPIGKRPRKSIISWALVSYRKFTPVDGRHELVEVTGSIWGETRALLLLGGRSGLFATTDRTWLRARITPAVPVPLARMTEEERARLRRGLDRRGIPIREVHDEGWARRALRALKVRRRERSR